MDNKYSFIYDAVAAEGQYLHADLENCAGKQGREGSCLIEPP